MKTSILDQDAVKATVRQRYGRIVTQESGCGCAPTCCHPNERENLNAQSPSDQPAFASASERLGYSKEDVQTAPEGSDFGLGCGNPQAIAALKPGENVLDLGSGAGFDVFLAARAVGPTGRVIENLPEPYRQAVILTELEGLTQKELAQRLGISLPAAKSRVQRGRQQLKNMLLACCHFEFDRRGGIVDCEPRKARACPECPSPRT